MNLVVCLWWLNVWLMVIKVYSGLTMISGFLLVFDGIDGGYEPSRFKIHSGQKTFYEKLMTTSDFLAKDH